MNDQQQAAERAALSDEELIHLGRNKNGMHPWGIGTTREDYLHAVRTVLEAALAQREPVAEGEVDDAIEQLFMLSSSDECARSFEPEFRDIALLLQRTESARLAAEDGLSILQQGFSEQTTQVDVLQAQLTAECEKSKHLGAALKDIKEWADYWGTECRATLGKPSDGDKGWFWAAQEVRNKLAAYQSSKDYPECSGDPRDCPENKGFGCCQSSKENGE